MLEGDIMSDSLPPRPSLERVKTQAKELLRDFRAGDAAAGERFGAVRPGKELKLADAQRVIAHEYGFSSWVKLKQDVEARVAADPLEALAAAVKANDVA